MWRPKSNAVRSRREVSQSKYSGTKLR
jgi:hypothetical protein